MRKKKKKRCFPPWTEKLQKSEGVEWDVEKVALLESVQIDWRISVYIPFLKICLKHTNDF